MFVAKYHLSGKIVFVIGNVLEEFTDAGLIIWLQYNCLPGNNHLFTESSVT